MFWWPLPQGLPTYNPRLFFRKRNQKLPKSKGLCTLLALSHPCHLMVETSGYLLSPMQHCHYCLPRKIPAGWLWTLWCTVVPLLLFQICQQGVHLPLPPYQYHKQNFTCWHLLYPRHHRHAVCRPQDQQANKFPYIHQFRLHHPT